MVKSWWYWESRQLNHCFAKWESKPPGPSHKNQGPLAKVEWTVEWLRTRAASPVSGKLAAQQSRCSRKRHLSSYAPSGTGNRALAKPGSQNVARNSTHRAVFFHGNAASNCCLGISLRQEPWDAVQDKIWQDMTRYDKIWQDMTRYDKIWQDMTRYDKIWLHTTSMYIRHFRSLSVPSKFARLCGMTHAWRQRISPDPSEALQWSWDLPQKDLIWTFWATRAITCDGLPVLPPVMLWTKGNEGANLFLLCVSTF